MHYLDFYLQIINNIKDVSLSTLKYYKLKIIIKAYRTEACKMYISIHFFYWLQSL